MLEIKELKEIREKAIEQTRDSNGKELKGQNTSWKRAYLRLADAADHLILKIDKCTEKVD